MANLHADEEANQRDYDNFVSDSEAAITSDENDIEYNNGLLVENANNTIEN
jgi:hypothetical protein